MNIDFGNLPSVHNVESIESEMPLLIESCCLREDGGGEGRRCGGVGMVRQVRLLGAEATYSVLSDRAVIPPFGVLGAGSGKPYHLSVETARATVEFDTPGKITGFGLHKGDTVIMRSSGGGGYGDPMDRAVDLVQEDVRTGIVSRARARDGYGVVLSDDDTIDTAATEARRKEMRLARFHLSVVADDDVECYVGAKGRRRVLGLAADDMTKLGAKDGDLVEIKGKHPAPLRAWLRTTDVTAGTAHFDEFGRLVLGISDGDQVTLRRLTMPPLPNGMAG